jgi:2-amino-4-hydroxy-6-hydroxymethyldihydropteridine diphosphokinase
MKKAYIALGTNLGERLNNLRCSLDMLSSGMRISVKAVSAVYETAPVGGPEQGSYLNACAAVDTDLAPAELLTAMLNVEQMMGRVREERWGPRNIDLDLLVFEDVIMKSPFLEIPHPRITGRDFVLVPLNDIAPDLIIPGQEKRVSEIIASRRETADVRLYLPAGWWTY